MSDTIEQVAQPETTASPLGDGGPSAEQIEQWKAQYAPSQLHLFDIGDTVNPKPVIIRTITRGEFAEVNNQQVNNQEFDKWLLDTYVLFPSVDKLVAWTEEMAGVLITVGDQIFRQSGFLQNVPTIRL